MNLRRKFREIIEGINNFFDWGSTIYQDRCYDYVYIYDIIQKKIELQAKHLKHYSNHSSIDISYNKMMTCVRLIDIVKNEEYINDVVFIDIHDTKSFEEYLEKHKATTHKVLTNKKLQVWENVNPRSVAYNVAEYKHNKAREVLFKIISENIHRWWY